MMIRETRTRRTMKAALVAVTAVATIGVLTGCGGGSSSSGSSPAAATPNADSSTYQLNTAAAARSGKAPTPSGDARTQLVYILEAVNPGVSTDEDSLVSKSVEICGHMLNGDSSTKITQETRTQFSNGSYTPSPAEVQAMDMAITATFCR
jgi:hypothetical protein